MKQPELPARPLPDLRPWAMGVLELPAETSRESMRAAFMQRLQQEDFVLPWREQQAFAVLASSSERLVRLALEQGSAATDEEDRLRAEVAEFAAAFFSLASDERAGRWKVLHAKCAWHPVLDSWLMDLERGLGVVSLEVNGTLETQLLAEAVAELFVLQGNAQARARHAYASRPRTTPADWEKAARQLQAEAVRIAALDPRCLQHLIDRCSRPVRREHHLKRQTERPKNVDYSALGFVGLIFGAMVFMGIVASNSQPKYEPPVIPSNFRPPWQQYHNQGYPPLGTGADSEENRRRYYQQMGNAKPFGTEPRREPNSTSQTPRKP